MRALLKKLKAEQSAVDKKEASMYSKVFQRMAQTSGSKQSKTDQVRLAPPFCSLWYPHPPDPSLLARWLPLPQLFLQRPVTSVIYSSMRTLLYSRAFAFVTDITAVSCVQANSLSKSITPPAHCCHSSILLVPVLTLPLERFQALPAFI